MNDYISDILDDARWEAEYGEGRDEKMTGVGGATVWIQRQGLVGFICTFDSAEIAFEFGRKFLREHTSDFRTELNGTQTCVEWRDSKGALWAYNTCDSLNAIKAKGSGVIGTGMGTVVGMYADMNIHAKVWDSKYVILQPSLAMKFGLRDV